MEDNHQVMPKFPLPKIDMDKIKKPSPYAIMSPRSISQKQPSTGKANCLCSPTTHVGSFRCRKHRTSGLLGRHSSSVGANLCELGSKTGVTLSTGMNNSPSPPNTHSPTQHCGGV